MSRTDDIWRMGDLSLALAAANSKLAAKDAQIAALEEKVAILEAEIRVMRKLPSAIDAALEMSGGVL